VPAQSNEKPEHGITVLDPTCGSGAFLFAALNILKPLYEVCLQRMQEWVDEADAADPASTKFKDFREILTRVNDRRHHPSRDYYVLKSIILNNLFGVDIMEEGVEICKLRLFLKLVAQVERFEDVEPLPDIDFNIRAGNTLVGFATLEEVRRAVEGARQAELMLGDKSAVLRRIGEDAETVDRAYRQFQEMQTREGIDANAFHEAKAEVRRRLEKLDEELNRYLAKEYGVDSGKPKDFAEWKQSHQPFHWFVEFYGIMARGGFDVVIGNPPYVEYSKVRSNYTLSEFASLRAGNLYAYVIERCFRLQHHDARIGMVIQLSAFCTPRMLPFQDVWFDNTSLSHISFFDDRPGKLFDGLEHIRVAIPLGQIRKATKATSGTATTTYIKFATEQRAVLFDSLWYQISRSARHESSVLKVSTEAENRIVRKVWAQKRKLGDYLQEAQNKNYVYYGYGYGYWGKILNYKSYFRGERVSASTGDKYIFCRANVDRDIIAALMNSSLFYWFYVNYSDGHNFTKYVISSLPFDYPSMDIAAQLKHLCGVLMKDLQRNARRKTAVYKATGAVEYDEYVPRRSKSIIDEIDRVLAGHYGFTDEELDFIINYDIKYRMGRESLEEEGVEEAA
jgi:hypothetical protein